MMSQTSVLRWLVLLLCSLGGLAANAQDTSSEETWQTCDTFFAPSTMGWGVFAARSFAEGEIVEVIPLALPVDSEWSDVIVHTQLTDYTYGYWRIIETNEPFAAHSFAEREIVEAVPIALPVDSESEVNVRMTLDDYIYRYWRLEANKVKSMSVVFLGAGSFFNHHTEPNVQYTGISREPGPGVPHASNVLGFVAIRDIQAGEELFQTYGKEDKGQSWFQSRRIPLKVPTVEETRIAPKVLPQKRADYCSKIYAGIGLPTLKSGVLPVIPPPDQLPFDLDPQQFAPVDAGVGNAIANHAISKGERIEIAPAMFLSAEIVKGTVLGPIILAWSDLHKEHQEAIQQLRKDGNLMLQYQSRSTNRVRLDRFQSFQELVVFPVAGTIGMVRRVGNDSDSSNCRLVIHSEVIEGAIGLTLELIATKDIGVGEILKLNLPTSGSKEEQAIFAKEMKLSGQTYYYEGLVTKTVGDDEL